jgi:hypothetical protein
MDCRPISIHSGAQIGPWALSRSTKQSQTLTPTEHAVAPLLKKLGVGRPRAGFTKGFAFFLPFLGKPNYLYYLSHSE